MKKTYKIVTIFVILLILVIAIVVYINGFSINTTNNISAEFKFKNEYEVLNGVLPEGKKHKYIDLNIPENNLIEYVTDTEVVEILKSGTGIIYFGMAECPWCRAMIIPLINTAKENNISKIYYFNPKKVREENTDTYKQMVELLNEYLNTDTATQKESDANFDVNKKRIYMPNVTFVKKGKVLKNHISTVDSHKDSSEPLTKEQVSELKQIFKDGIDKIYYSTCSDSKDC